MHSWAVCGYLDFDAQLSCMWLLGFWCTVELYVVTWILMHSWAVCGYLDSDAQLSCMWLLGFWCTVELYVVTWILMHSWAVCGYLDSDAQLSCMWLLGFWCTAELYVVTLMLMQNWTVCGYLDSDTDLNCVFCLDVSTDTVMLQAFQHGHKYIHFVLKEQMYIMHMYFTFLHLYCSAQLSMFNMEKCNRNKIIIIIASRYPLADTIHQKITSKTIHGSLY